VQDGVTLNVLVDAIDQSNHTTIAMVRATDYVHDSVAERR
jgi:hypothetical protein